MTLKEKYIEERYPRYCSIPDGNLDEFNHITDGTDIVVSDLSTEEASHLISQRDSLLDAYIEISNLLNDLSPEGYNIFYYGEKPA